MWVCMLSIPVVWVIFTYWIVSLSKCFIDVTGCFSILLFSSAVNFHFDIKFISPHGRFDEIPLKENLQVQDSVSDSKTSQNAIFSTSHIYHIYLPIPNIDRLTYTISMYLPITIFVPIGIINERQMMVVWPNS